MRNYKLYVTLLVVVLTAANAASAGFGPPEQIVSTKTFTSVDALRPGDSFEIAVKATVKAGCHIGAADKDALYPAKLTFTAPKGVSFEPPVYPAAVRKALKIAPDQKVPVYEGEFVVRAKGQVARGAKLGPITITSKLDTQACTDGQCYPPSIVQSMAKVSVVTAGAKVSSVNSDLFKGASASVTGSTEAERMFQRLEGANVIVRLLILYFVGLLLAFTPCVYPMVPVTVGYFSTQGESKTRKVVVLAAAYVLGLALTYSVLGAVAATTGGLIGSAMQRPPVLIGIAVVLVGLALSMFGLYELKPPAFIESRSSGRSGVLGALVMGTIFGIVAAPCVGPAVLGLLLYVAHMGNPLTGFMLFFVMALGMGTPLFFLAAFSAKLPTPGLWMVAAKKVAGFLLIGAAAYFLLPIVPEPYGRYLMPSVIVVAGIYLGFLERSLCSSKLACSFGRAFGAGALVVAALMVMPKASGPLLKWEPYQPSSIGTSAKAGKHSMVDFTAEWCGVCKELERGPFSDPAVIKAADGFRRFRVDGTNRSDAQMLSAVKRYEIQGFPAVLFFDSSGHEVRSARITGFVSSAEMIKRIESVK